MEKRLEGGKSDCPGTGQWLLSQASGIGQWLAVEWIIQMLNKCPKSVVSVFGGVTSAEKR